MDKKRFIASVVIKLYKITQLRTYLHKESTFFRECVYKHNSNFFSRSLYIKNEITSMPLQCKKVVYNQGEDERVLRALQAIGDIPYRNIEYHQL